MSISHESKEERTKYHRPNERLRKYIEQKSHLLKQIKSIEAREKEAKTKNQEEPIQIQQEREELYTRTKTLANLKIQVLDDILFPSMANLTYFFNELSKDAELQDVFNSDISEILGIRREHPRPNNYAFMFVHLIHGMISREGDEYQENDFRIRLIYELQNLISWKFQGLAMTTFPTGQIRFSAFKAVNDDMNRVLAWTQMLALQVLDEYNFDDPVLGPKKIPDKILKNKVLKRKYKQKREIERWEEFDSKQHKPKRTITFD